MSWSPDGEMVILYSRPAGEPATIYMLVCHGSDEIEPLTDFPFSQQEFGEGTSLHSHSAIFASVYTPHYKSLFRAPW